METQLTQSVMNIALMNQTPSIQNIGELDFKPRTEFQVSTAANLVVSTTPANSASSGKLPSIDLVTSNKIMSTQIGLTNNLTSNVDNNLHHDNDHHVTFASSIDNSNTSSPQTSSSSGEGMNHSELPQVSQNNVLMQPQTVDSNGILSQQQQQQNGTTKKKYKYMRRNFLTPASATKKGVVVPPSNSKLNLHEKLKLKGADSFDSSVVPFAAMMPGMFSMQMAPPGMIPATFPMVSANRGPIPMMTYISQQIQVSGDNHTASSTIPAMNTSPNGMTMMMVPSPYMLPIYSPPHTIHDQIPQPQPQVQAQKQQPVRQSSKNKRKPSIMSPISLFNSFEKSLEEYERSSNNNINQSKRNSKIESQMKTPPKSPFKDSRKMMEPSTKKKFGGNPSIKTANLEQTLAGPSMLTPSGTRFVPLSAFLQLNTSSPIQNRFRDDLSTELGGANQYQPQQYHHSAPATASLNPGDQTPFSPTREFLKFDLPF